MTVIVSVTILIYFFLLLWVSHSTSKNAGNGAFFNGEKQTPWYMVAFGMIGASLSGVTFVSVPGMVLADRFTYLQMVAGNVLGYWIIAFFLIPLYYKTNLVSIYGFIERRFGVVSCKTTSFFFILSKLAGASFRLFLVILVIKIGVFDNINLPFFVPAALVLAMIFVYTRKAGIKTIVRTDILQTIFMLLSLVVTVVVVCNKLNFSFSDVLTSLKTDERATIFDFNVSNSTFFVKHFVSGIFMAVVMNGLDQDMMQKNLSCKNAKESQKNVFWFSIIQIPVVCLFLTLGLLLYIYADSQGIDVKGDNLFPQLAFNNLGIFVATVFVIGIVAAAFSSADSALTAMTTTICVDFLGMDTNSSSKTDQKKRTKVHLLLMFAVFVIITIFSQSDKSIVNLVFKTAGYTYGPVLGIFALALFTKIKINDRLTPYVMIFPPILCFIFAFLSEKFWGYNFGFEILILNGFITFLMLLMIKNKEKSQLK